MTTAIAAEKTPMARFRAAERHARRTIGLVEGARDLPLDIQMAAIDTMTVALCAMVDAAQVADRASARSEALPRAWAAIVASRSGKLRDELRSVRRKRGRRG